MARVSNRLLLSFITYLLLLVGVVSATAVVLRRQHDDGLVVNLSGRQRMLTQRMTHQLLTYASKVDAGIDPTEARNRVKGTMRVFETTLMALIEGGPAPTDLQMTTFRDCPPGSHAVAQRLLGVREIYQRYRSGAEAVLGKSPDARRAGIETIIGIESDLLMEMDSAVSLLQREAERKVTDLYFIQGGSLLLAVVLTFLLMRWVRLSVLDPLDKLREAAEEMSLGNLHRAVPAQGSLELRSLAESFERMRTSVRALLESRRRSDPVSMEIADW